ncbi:hypothetical protein C2G38_2047425 [Gigaspora rosea]|uniref:SWIM-type domain-containing protein n=1 Tax=Gigaspora rosea TaxID=44941 RepID=A0A397U633_9GLOM|nr:hypothetical protein C2G38_2047425 [Gigaspora rosea]
MISSSKETQKQRQYEERIREIPSTNNILTIYPEIEILVDRYLEPNVARFIVGQLKESIYYTAHLLSIEEVKSLPANNPSESENFEDEPDNIFMCAQFLLQRLDLTKINEIWNISRITDCSTNHVVFCFTDGSYCCTCLLQQKRELVCQHYFHLLNITKAARFNMRLINIRWIPLKYCTDEIMNRNYYGQRFTNSAIDSNMNKEVEHNQSFKYLQPFNDHKQNNVNDGLIKEQLFYEEVWGLVRSATRKCLLYQNRDFVNLIEDYLSNIHEREKEYQAQQAIDFENNNDDDDSDKENTSISIKLKNLLKVFTKGRPKLSAYRNDNIVNQQKAKDLTHDKPRRDYHCSYCKNKGHNIATCPEKDKDT